MAGLTPSLHKEFQDALNVSNIVPFKDNVWDAKSVNIGNPTETKFASIGYVALFHTSEKTVLKLSNNPFNILPLVSTHVTR